MGITISGFNDIDWGALADAIIQSESQPLTNLSTKKSTLETQNTAFGTLAGKLSTLQSSFEALKTTTSMAGLSVSSSDSAVGVSAASGTVAGTYDVSVTQLAKQQVTASTTTYGATTDVVATGGTMVLRDGTGHDSVITVTGPLTVQELADKINATNTATVSAAVVQTTPGSYQLVLTGRESGQANGFSVNTSGMTGGTRPVFTDTDADGFSGDTAADNKQSALNATLTINGLGVSSASNVVDGAVPGVTLTLAKLTTGPVSVQVSRDSSQGTDKINKLISAYNDLVTFLDSQRTAEISGKPGISRDPLVRSLRDNMRAAFMGQYSGGGSFTRLAEIGLGFDRSGKLTLDKDIYNAAITDTPNDVQALFSSAGTGGKGAFGALDDLIGSYTDSGGLVASLRDRLTDSIDNMGDRIDAMQAQLDQRRAALMKEYTAADQTMSLLKKQASTLSSLDNMYRLF